MGSRLHDVRQPLLLDGGLEVAEVIVLLTKLPMNRLELLLQVELALVLKQ